MNTINDPIANRERLPMGKKLAFLIATITVVGGVLLWWIFGELASNSKMFGTEATEVASVTTVQKPAIRDIVFNSRQLASNGGVTSGSYMPGIQRPVKPADAQLVKAGKVGKWWLYARSVEEAAWMDHFGYPTPAEDKRLVTLLDEELEKMGREGDVNAKTLYGVRQAQKAILRSDERGVKLYAGYVASMAIVNGPYAAAEGIALCHLFERELEKTPLAERTQTQKNMTEEFAKLYATASEISALYSDYTATGLKVGITESSSRNIPVDLSYGESVTASIAMMSSNRIKNGLGPLVILPRPEVKGKDVGVLVPDIDPMPVKGQVLERY